MMADPDIFVFDSTVLNDLQACARKLEFGHVKNWRPLSGKATPLDRGSMLHDMLALYRTLLKLSWREGNPECLTKSEAAFLAEQEIAAKTYNWNEIVELSIMLGRLYMATQSENLTMEEGEEIIRNFAEYVDFYQNDGWQPIEVEAAFSRILYESPELILVVEGRIDLITDSRSGRTVVDSKTASRRQEPVLLSNQFICYAWATDVPSVTVDKIGFQKTLKAKDRFQRHILSYPKELKEEWREWAIYWGKMAAFYVREGIFPPNFTSCDKYGGCIYLPICSTTPKAREWKASTLFRVGEQWSPQNKELKTSTASVTGKEAE